MINNFPKIIKILSDDNQLELEDTIPNKSSKEKVGVYVYTKSITKVGMRVPLSISQINDMYKKDRIEIG